jgi:hypothetical protein
MALRERRKSRLRCNVGYRRAELQRQGASAHGTTLHGLTCHVRVPRYADRDNTRRQSSTRGNVHLIFPPRPRMGERAGVRGRRITATRNLYEHRPSPRPSPRKRGEGENRGRRTRETRRPYSRKVVPWGQASIVFAKLFTLTRLSPSRAFPLTSPAHFPARRPRAPGHGA